MNSTPFQSPSVSNQLILFLVFINLFAGKDFVDVLHRINNQWRVEKAAQSVKDNSE